MRTYRIDHENTFLNFEGRVQGAAGKAYIQLVYFAEGETRIVFKRVRGWMDDLTNFLCIDDGVTAQRVHQLYPDVQGELLNRVVHFVNNKADEFKAMLSTPGMYFEEFEVGQTFTTDERVVNYEDISTFVDLTGDDNRLHLDDDFARAAGFKGRIAHGALVVALAIGKAWETGILKDTTLSFRAIEEWKFSQPTYPGDSVAIKMTVIEVRPMPRLKAGLVKFEGSVVNHKGIEIATNKLVMLMRSKPPEPKTPGKEG